MVKMKDKEKNLKVPFLAVQLRTFDVQCTHLSQVQKGTLCRFLQFHGNLHDSVQRYEERSLHCTVLLVLSGLLNIFFVEGQKEAPDSVRYTEYVSCKKYCRR